MNGRFGGPLIPCSAPFSLLQGFALFTLLASDFVKHQVQPFAHSAASSFTASIISRTSINVGSSGSGFTVL